jgi:hypothetical protein
LGSDLGDFVSALFVVDDLWHVVSPDFLLAAPVLCSATVVVERASRATEA